MFIKIDGNWLNTESISSIQPVRDDANAAYVVMGDGQHIKLRISVDNVAVLLANPGGLHFGPELADRKPINPDAELSDDEDKAHYFKEGWEKFGEELWRRLIPYDAGVVTRVRTLQGIADFVAEQIPRGRRQEMERAWALDREARREVGRWLGQGSAPKERGEAGQEANDTPVTKVAAPEVGPDALLTLPGGGWEEERVAVSGLRLQRRELDRLVKQANGGANISNFTMARRVAELLGIELVD